MLLPPPYRSVSRKFCLLVSAREAVACCWLRYISRGPSLWPTLVFEWACPPRAASPAVLGVWPIELYLPGPITWPFGYRVDLCPPREASPAVLGVCTVELFLPGPILLAKFGYRVSLNPPRVGPILLANFGDRVDLCPPREASPAVLGVWPIELYLSGPFILAKFGDRVGLFWPREASPAVLGVCTFELYLGAHHFGPVSLIEWVFARRVRRLGQFWACDRLRHISRYPSFWPSLVSSGRLADCVISLGALHFGQVW